jgi:hypothetical protein
MGRMHVNQKLGGPEGEGKNADNPSLPGTRPIGDRWLGRQILIVTCRLDRHVCSPYFIEAAVLRSKQSPSWKGERRRANFADGLSSKYRCFE